MLPVPLSSPPTSPHYDLVPKDIVANLKFRRDVLKMAGEDPAAAAQLKTMCAEDLMFYVNAFCWTYDPRNANQSVVPFITYEDFQDETMLSIADCVENGGDYAIAKSRDMGASWMGLTVYEWFWHFRPALSFLLISRNEDYVDKRGNPKSLFWKVDFLHENQPRWLLPPGRWLGFNDPERKLLHLGNAENGSVIDGESTTGDAGRGDRRTAMFIDEHAAFELNDGFRVLRATRDTTRCRGFNSTPQGANNGFFEVVHSTAAKQIRLHWSKHPEKSLGLYTTDEHGAVELFDSFCGKVELIRKGEDRVVVKFPEDYPFRLDGKLRSPWYDNECARCVSEMEIGQELDIDFLGSDYQFFDAEFIDVIRKRYCRDPSLIGDLEFDPETFEPKRFVENKKGNIALWLTLDAHGRPAADRAFVLGSDVSAGTGASNSVSCVVDRKTGEKVGVLRSPHLRPTQFAAVTIAMARFFNRAFMIWDASGPTGRTFTQCAIKSGYGYFYYRRNEKKIGQKISDEPGYYLNSQAKESLLEDYRDALSDKRILNRSDQGMKECLQFIRKPDGTIEHSAAAHSQDPSGARTAHGDEVIADALAVLGLSNWKTTIDSNEPEIPYGSLAWRIGEKKKLSAATADVLGEGW